jgi:hypothetical protein
MRIGGKKMELLAHTTPFEVAAGIAIFVAGAWMGIMVAHSLYGWIQQRRQRR